MANNTGLDEADVEPGDLRTRLCQNATRSLVTPPVKFRILKIHAAETRRGKRPPRWEAPDFPRQRPAHCPLPANPRECRRFSHTWKSHRRDRTGWLGREDSNLRMAESKSAP